MSRRKKEDIVAELKTRGIEFDEDASYWDLWKLLTEPKPAAGTTSDTGPLLARLPKELIERAKSIGFTDEQIGTYTDVEALERACNQIKPQATPHLPPKPRQIYKSFPDEPKGEPAQAVCTSQINTMRAAHVQRADYDEMNLQTFCRHHKPKIISETIQKVTVERDYVPDKRGILTSTMVIDYLKKG
jgi:hypothetical protein